MFRSSGWEMRVAAYKNGVSAGERFVMDVIALSIC